MRVVVRLACGLLVVCGLYLALVTIGAARSNTCGQEGPWSPAAGSMHSANTVRQDLSWWPLGRRCEWQRDDGRGTVTTHSGTMLLTTVTYGSLVLGAAGLFRPRRRSIPPER